jgi:DNA-binding Lrp family transcriptional regulator
LFEKIQQFVYSAAVMTMDAIDTALLTLLHENARMSVTDLAAKLGVARSTVQARMERLEQSGIIAGYTVRSTAAEPALRAFVSVKLDPRAQAAVEAGLRRLAAVQTVYSVAGPYDLLVRTGAPNSQQLDEALDAIRAMPGVQETMTSILLSRKFDRSG